jgi:hypothetical protein
MRRDEYGCSGVCKNHSRSRLGGAAIDTEQSKRMRLGMTAAVMDVNGSGLDVWCKSRIAIDRPARAVLCEPCANQKSFPTSLPLCTVKSRPRPAPRAGVSQLSTAAARKGHRPFSTKRRGLCPAHWPSCHCPARARVVALHSQRDSLRLESSSSQTTIAAPGVAPWEYPLSFARHGSAV